MKFIIAGTGSIGRRHITNILHIKPSASFILIRADNRLDDLSEELGATVVGSVEDAIGLQPDCAIIATPSALHVEYILELIKYNLPMYVEKPVVTNQRDIDAIRSCICKYNYKATTIVGCNLRFLNAFSIVRKMLENNELGVIARASFQAGQWLPDWRPQQDYRKSYSADPNRGGGVLWDLIHELDAVRYFMGEFDRVKTMTANFQSLEISSEAVAVLVLGKSKGGPLVSVGLDYVARKPVRRYEIYGDKSSIVLDISNKRLQKQSSDKIEMITDDVSDFDIKQTYVQAMEEFITGVEKGVGTSQGLEEGLKSAELVISAKDAGMSAT